MTKKGPRDLGRDPITGEKIHDKKWINEQVALTSARTNIEHTQHAAEANVRYAVTQRTTLPVFTSMMENALAIAMAEQRENHGPWYIKDSSDDQQT